MDDGNQPTTDGADTSPHASRDVDPALQRVTSTPGQNRPSSAWCSPHEIFRATASRPSTEALAPTSPRWAVATKPSDTLVESAERPEKRIRLDDYAAAHVRASSPESP